MDTIATLSNLVDRGLLVSSEDFAVEKLPDGRSKVRLLRTLKATAHVCPHTGTQLTVTFSGIIACGCVQTSFSPDPERSVHITSLNINQAFVLPRISTGPPFDAWQATFSSILEYDAYSNASCIEPPDDHAVANIRITVQCLETGWSIEALSPGPNLDVFEATDFLGNQNSVPNSVTCGSLISGPGIASVGTAKITVP